MRIIPVGEFHRNPAGQRRLYIGKERIDETATYDYGPRDYHAAGLYWEAPDLKAKDYPGTSPYTMCAANPILFIDPTGMAPTAYEASLMARLSYLPSLEEKELGEEDRKIMNYLTQNGWEVVKPKGHHDASGLDSYVFVKKDEEGNEMEYACAFAGTSIGRDLISDVTQVIGVSIQYMCAILQAKNLDEELGARILTFVGHSLGGGEAIAASMATGRDAITFNPAAVSAMTKYFCKLNNPGKVESYVSSNSEVTPKSWTG